MKCGLGGCGREKTGDERLGDLEGRAGEAAFVGAARRRLEVEGGAVGWEVRIYTLLGGASAAWKMQNVARGERKERK